MRSGRSTHTFLRFSFCSLVTTSGTSLAQNFCMPSSKVKISWMDWRFKFDTLLIILSNVDQTARDPSLWSHFLPFLKCKFFQNEVRLSQSHGHSKMHLPPKNPCLWYSMLSISPFQFFVSLCCVFIKFDTKFHRATLLEISFLHFRNASLLYTLTQLAVNSDVLKLSSWNLHWSSSENICIGWCLRCGYSIANCWATHSVFLLSWRTTYISSFGNDRFSPLLF